MRLGKARFKGIMCALLTGAMIMVSVAPASAATARATTMKLEKTEGTVTLKTQNGSARKITKGMRLYNGNTLATAKYSYAHISLDSTKAVKLDQNSSATLRQSGNQLELLVKNGKLFFNVSKKLDSKESMNVRTSTMVTGVRGTCGVVEYVNQNKSKLYLIEGQVTLGTGQNATVVQGGQVATVILEDKPSSTAPGKPGVTPGDPEKPDETDKEVKQKVVVEKLTEKTIPPVALQEIVANPVLQEKIEKTTELKIEKIEEALEQFEKEEAERIEQEKAEQEKEEEKDKDKEQEDKKEDENTTSSGGGSYTPDTPALTSATLFGTVSAAAINAALTSYSKVIVATDGKDADGNQVETSVTLEDNVEVPAGKVLIMKTGKVTNAGKLSCGYGTLIDCGNIAGITDTALLTIMGSVTTVYANDFNPQVADYINELAQIPDSVKVSFERKAVVKSNITLQPASSSQQTIQLIMNGNTLEIESGTLTLASNVSITSSSTDATVSLSGGNLVLQGTSTASSTIKNESTGITIKRTGGEFTWNDTGLHIAGSNGANTAIEGAEVAGETVKLPDWVKTKYVPVWQNNKVVLYSVPAEFTSGTVSAADLNQALNLYQAVTVGENAKANLSSSDTVTIPTGKTLTIESKVTPVGTNKYSGGFYLGKSTPLTLEEKANLYVYGNGFLGGNGIITVGAGATISVNANCTLHADKINLTNGSSLTNKGTIDGGTLSLEGTGKIENHALIKMKTCESNSDSSYSYVDVNNESILVLDGYGFSNSPFTGISRLACVMASTGSSDENNLFKPLVSVYANKLNQLAAAQMKGNRTIYEEPVVQVNVSKNVEVKDNITWDLAGAGVGMAGFKVNLAAGKALTLKNINSFGGTGDTLIEVGSGATLTISQDGSITARSPRINLGLATGSAISVADGAKVSLQDPGLTITVKNTADHIISGMEVTNGNVTVPNCVETLSGYTCKVENRSDSNGYSSLSLVKVQGNSAEQGQ